MHAQAKNCLFLCRFVRSGNSHVKQVPDFIRGGIYALHPQSGLNILSGGRTALVLLGKAHYLELNAKMISLFGGSGDNLPNWLEKFD